MAEGRIVVGIGGWTFAPWRETFYPSDLPKTRELEWASRQVTSIEINGTFYRTQTPATYRKWAAETPDDFVFSVKAHRVTTNRRDLGEAKTSIDNFLGSGVLELGPKLGPILWQLAPTKKFDAGQIEAFLSHLPREKDGMRLRHAMEVRHESFRDAAFVDLMRSAGVAIVFADSEKYPEFFDVTADFVYLRLESAQAKIEQGYPADDITLWSTRMATWANGGVPDDLSQIAPKKPPKLSRDCFVYAINGAKERAPAAAKALLAALQS